MQDDFIYERVCFESDSIEEIESEINEAWTFLESKLLDSNMSSVTALMCAIRHLIVAEIKLHDMKKNIDQNIISSDRK